MAYLLLVVAICSEVVGTVSLKLSEGFSKPVPSIAVVIGYAVAFTAMSAVRSRAATSSRSASEARMPPPFGSTMPLPPGAD